MAPIASKPTPESEPMAETLRSLGESELIRRLAQFAPARQLDDDTADLPASSQRQVINTDLLVEGVHFSDATTSAEDVGWRAAAVNLSDLAASGADSVVGLTVGLVAPGETAWTWVDGVYRGLQTALDRYGGVLLGGDCSSGQQRMLAVNRHWHPRAPQTAALGGTTGRLAGDQRPPRPQPPRPCSAAKRALPQRPSPWTGIYAQQRPCSTSARPPDWMHSSG